MMKNLSDLSTRLFYFLKDKADRVIAYPTRSESPEYREWVRSERGRIVAEIEARGKGSG